YTLSLHDALPIYPKEIFCNEVAAVPPFAKLKGSIDDRELVSIRVSSHGQGGSCSKAQQGQIIICLHIILPVKKTGPVSNPAPIKIGRAHVRTPLSSRIHLP